MTVQPFVLGFFIGVLVAAPVFVSRGLAIGVLGQVAIAVLAAIVTSGPDSVHAVYQNASVQIANHPTFVLGLLLGMAVVGVVIAAVRESRN